MFLNADTDEIVRTDFEAIQQFVEGLHAPQGSIVRNMEIKDQTQTPVVKAVMQSFERIAQNYFELARQAITDEEQDEQKRTYHYGKVLRRLTEHAQLLSQVSYFHPAQVLENWPLIESTIGDILTRITPPPMFIPLIASEFKYVHLNYMDNVALIGLPPSFWANPTWSLSMLWHEVGGYAVAVARRNGDLEQWAESLRDRLKKIDTWHDYYLNRYKKSRLKDVTVGLEVTPTGYKIANSRKIRAYLKELASDNAPRGKETPRKRKNRSSNVESDPGWQMDWLGEFFEDLFGVQALGSVMLKILAEALLRGYSEPDLGDQEHPPPDLRLQVVLDFLDRSYSGGAAKRKDTESILADLQARYKSLSRLKFGQGNGASDNFKQTAEAIVDLYYATKVEYLSLPELGFQEEDRAKVVYDIYHQPPKDNEELYQRLDLSQERGDEEQSYSIETAPFVAKPSDYIWTLIKPSIKLKLDADLAYIAKAGSLKLDELLAVKFIDTDEGGPLLGTPPPFPP